MQGIEEVEESMRSLTQMLREELSELRSAILKEQKTDANESKD